MIKLDKQISFIKLKEKGADELDKPLYGSVLRTLQKLADAEKLEEGDFGEYKKAYFEFHNKVRGFNPKFNGSEGKALKEIIQYMNGEAKDGNGIQVWRFLLENWHLQSTWMQDQTMVIQINKYLTELLGKVKKKGYEQQQSTDELEELRRAAGK